MILAKVPGAAIESPPAKLGLAYQMNANKRYSREVTLHQEKRHLGHKVFSTSLHCQAESIL